MPKLLTFKTRPSRTQRPTTSQLKKLYGTADWTPSGEGALTVLELLAEYRYLTREMLALILRERHGRESGNQVAQHLARLWRFSYVNRFYRPTERGSSQYVYALTQRGARLVLDPEDFEARKFQITNAAKPKAGYDHALGILLFRILWDLGSPAFSDHFKTKDYWLDQDADGSRKAGTTRNSFTVRLDGKTVKIKPDSTIWIAWKKKSYYQPLFLEFERTHKNDERTVRRFRAYKMLLTSQHGNAVIPVCRKHLDSRISPKYGQVLFLTADEDHRQRLMRLAKRETPNTTSSRHDFMFATIQDLFDQDGDNEQIIPPPELFTRQLATHIKGKPWSIVA